MAVMGGIRAPDVQQGYVLCKTPYHWSALTGIAISGLYAKAQTTYY
jgi:hypothetical protein